MLRCVDIESKPGTIMDAQPPACVSAATLPGLFVVQSLAQQLVCSMMASSEEFARDIIALDSGSWTMLMIHGLGKDGVAVPDDAHGPDRRLRRGALVERRRQHRRLHPLAQRAHGRRRAERAALPDHVPVPPRGGRQRRPRRATAAGRRSSWRSSPTTPSRSPTRRSRAGSRSRTTSAWPAGSRARRSSTGCFAARDVQESSPAASVPQEATTEALGGELVWPSFRGHFEQGAADVVYARVTSSGGFGDPLAREPEKVAQDVEDGYVSTEVARVIYGVGLADGRRRSSAGRRRRCAASCSARGCREGSIPRGDARREARRAPRPKLGQINPALGIYGAGGREVIACAACRTELAEQGANYKEGCREHVARARLAALPPGPAPLRDGHLPRAAPLLLSGLRAPARRRPGRAGRAAVPRRAREGVSTVRRGDTRAATTLAPTCSTAPPDRLETTRRSCSDGERLSLPGLRARARSSGRASCAGSASGRATRSAC